MKKTFNINIAGKVFTIDEDAYTLLSDYLDTLSFAVKDLEEGNELTEDIEERVSELLTERQEEDGSVIVTIRNVEEIIARIGKPEEILELDEFEVNQTGNSSGGTETIEVEEPSTVTPPPLPPIKKRLFRDPQGKILGGVCGGIGAYFNIDPTWIRLLFVALFIFSYSSIFLIYILLWIILPEAKTPLERMQMTGEQPTVENIGRNVTSFFRNDNNPTPAEPVSGWKRLAQIITNIAGIMAKILVIILSVLAVPAVLILAIAFVGVIIALIVFMTSSISMIDSPISHSETIWGLLCALGFIIVIGIPAVMLVISLFRKSQSQPALEMKKGWKTALIITWIVGLILAGVSAGVLNSKDSMNELIEMRENMIDATKQMEEAREQMKEANDRIEEAQELIREGELTKEETDSIISEANSIVEQTQKLIPKK